MKSAANSSPPANMPSGGGKIARQKHAGKPGPHWVWDYRRNNWRPLPIQPWERYLLHQAMASLGLVCECPPRVRAPVAFYPKRVPKKGLGKIERELLRQAAKRAGF